MSIIGVLFGTVWAMSRAFDNEASNIYVPHRETFLYAALDRMLPDFSLVVGALWAWLAGSSNIQICTPFRAAS